MTLGEFFGSGGLGGLDASRSGLVALHAVSGLLIALAYLIISAGLWTFLRRRRDLDRSARGAGWLFTAFILAAALFHIASIVGLWVPSYATQGALKAITAVAALAAAMVFWRQLPRLLELPSPRDLARIQPRSWSRPTPRSRRPSPGAPTSSSAPTSASSRRCRARTSPSTPRIPTSASRGSTTPASACARRR